MRPSQRVWLSLSHMDSGSTPGSPHRVLDGVRFVVIIVRCLLGRLYLFIVANEVVVDRRSPGSSVGQLYRLT